MSVKKNVIINKDNSIKKSNEISTAKLFYGLTLNQIQLFSYAIYVTQKNGKTKFHKSDFEKKFDIDQYHTSQAKQDSRALIGLAVELKVEESDQFKFRNVFQGIDYERGVFVFEWSEYIKPHILELKNKFIETDLGIAMKFKSSFSWTLYDLIKASYGRRFLTFSKSELMSIFNVSNVKSYKKNTSLFKRNVLDVAIKDINTHTEYFVEYEEVKKGRAIEGFKLYFRQKETYKRATEKQIKYLDDLEKEVKKYGWKEIVKIENSKQRDLATYVLENIIELFNEKNKDIKFEKADELIKKINEKKIFIQKIIEDDNKNNEKSSEKNPYSDIEIPIFENLFEGGNE